MKFKKLLGFVMLLTVIGVEADDCPIEIDPTAVVVKYGDPVSVNCTVSTDHLGMGWVAKQNPVPIQSGVQSRLWSVKNLTAWDINPMCFANFEGAPQCDKQLSVTVYKTPDSVSIRSENHTGPLVEGSQYRLVCEVQNVAPVQNLTVKWYRGTEVVNITLFSGESKTPVNVSSTLPISPSRTDNGALYKCVTELYLGPEGPQPPPAVKSELFSITVHYSPVISVGDENVTVAQGEMVSLHCSAQGNPSPHVQWILPSGNVHYTTMKNNSTATEVSCSADSPGVYICTASNYLGNTTRIVSVTVDSPSSLSLTTAALSKALNDNEDFRVMILRIPVVESEPFSITLHLETDDCPIEIDPPAVVVKYGDPVSVNCTVSTDHLGMGWVAKQNPVPIQSGVQSLLWSVEKLTAWDTNPMCFANLKGAPQCDKQLSVTVYKTPDSVSISSLDSTGPLVEGSQYRLVCEVQNVAPVQNLTVKWYRGTEVVNITLFSGESKTPVNVSSTLPISPSRTDNGALYKCVTELYLGPEGPQPPPAVKSELFSITVHYSPVISVGDENVTVAQGEMVSLHCSAQGNPSPHVQWILPSGNVHYTTMKNNSTATEVSCSADSPGVYICTASNYLGNTTRIVSVTVDSPSSLSLTTAALSKALNDNEDFRVMILRIPVVESEPFSITLHLETDDCPIEIDPPAVVVKYGDPVSVNCTVSTDHLGMGWVAKQNPVPIQSGVQSLLWSVEKLTAWDTNPMCFANLKGAPQCDKQLSVTVYKTPDSVSISSLDSTGPLVEGRQYRLVCEVQNVAPVQNLTVKWYKSNEVVNITLFSGESKTPVNVSSTVLITPNRTDNGAQYRCVVELHLGSEGPRPPPAVESEPFSITVHYPPVISEGDDNVTVAQGGIVSLFCSVQGNPSPRFHWTLPSRNVDLLTFKKNNSITIDASPDNSGVYTCSASNYLGNTTRKVSLTVAIKDYTIFAVIPLAILLLLLVFILFHMKRKRQCGNYSVSKRHSECTVNPNDIPMQCLIGNGAHKSLQKSTADPEDQD